MTIKEQSVGNLPDTPEGVTYVYSDATDLPVGVEDKRGLSVKARIVMGVFAIMAAAGWAVVAFNRGEQINAMWLVFAAVGSYFIAFTTYARFIEMKVVKPRADRATPAEYDNDGKDFMPTDRRVLFGHHFAAIAGAGPLVGPIMAAQMGYLPSTLWIIVGVILAGAVQDYLTLWISTRRRGRSLGQMLRDEVGPVGGYVGMFAIATIMLLLIAVLALVVVNALAESPWGVFSLAMTIPIALFMGVYLRYIRPGAVAEVSAIGVVLLLAAIIGGGYVADTTWGAETFTLSKTALSWCLIIYGVVAAILPVWLLLAPRDYLSTFMKVGVVFLLALGIVVSRPVVQMPAVTEFAKDGTGPVFAGNLFPFLFITIACGALSGFHALVSSGTTPKLVEKESQMRMIGYGSMLIESFVAMTALVAAIILDRHLYFAMNAPASVTGGTPESASHYVNGLNIPGDGITAEQLQAAAHAIGEPSIVSRTGGAPTFAFGMSDILTDIFGNPGLQAFWYHFAIMFEALFILTTIDAGTRVARFIISDTVGSLPGLSKFKNPHWKLGSWIATIIVCGGWGSILLMGVTDPLGGINMLFPLFGIANQLLAAIALALITVVVVKKGYAKYAWIPGIPLVWDVVITMYASWQKIFSDVPAIGYWAQHAAFKDAQAQGLTKFGTAKSAEEIAAVIRNTAVQGSLSIFYALLVLIVVVTCVIAIVNALRAQSAGQEVTTSEEPFTPSAYFAPTGVFATDIEKPLVKAWAEREPKIHKGH
ncbi:carbon starvation protein A [Corynebacterium sp. 4HC-13]|uniref:carbon starvation CstA family protein n=1 Tax=Corynebacterium anserum TaxID=2684406 RepID=UPI00163A4AB2|nr:carbon starvation CstA family protein [Corynebacterium anserum]MBC2681096.1 carbon starvation protein A [Corynebacterium anserum]